MGYKQLSVVLFVFVCHELAFSSSTLPQLCKKDQSIFLLKFKKTLTVDPSASGLCDYYGQKSYVKTSTWNVSRDCCLWDGVICDEFTGHVTELDLSCSQLKGIVDPNSSLFQLSYLQRFNLSFNFFHPSEISPLFGRFSHLTHLDLSYSDFTGQIPYEISHLSKLQSLYLSSNTMLSLEPHNFKLLLQNLTQLRELDLSRVNIYSIIPPNISSHITTLMLAGTGLHGALPESIFHLPNLEILDLGSNYQLSGYFPKTKWNNSESLRELYLSGVNFSNDFLPESLGYLTSLQRLKLKSCNLSGPVPKSLWSLTRIEGRVPLFTSGLQNLEVLSLSNNSLDGAIPSWVFSLPSLREMYLNDNRFSGQLEDFKSNALVEIALGGNQLQGHLPKSIQNLVNLTLLHLSSNNFSGIVDVNFFSNLKQLKYLDLSYNSISLTNDDNVKSTLPESLTHLSLSGCQVKELDFLRSAKNLHFLDLSNNKIQGTISDWEWSNWMYSLNSLNLSHNMLTSFDNIYLLPLYAVDLRSNFLHGSLPNPPPSVGLFFISNNSLSGEIPSFFCNLTSLIVLDLARNNLEGAIPQCLGNMSDRLEVLDMQHNSLSGNLQTTFRVGSGLKSFNLHGNKVEGKIPKSLANCKELEVLDLGNNHLNDTFPMWLGTLSKLQVLSLRSNKLHGPIRASRTKNLFPHLHILDLSCNAFTTELPTSLFHHLKAMMRIDQTIKVRSDDRYYEDSVTVVTKGLELEVVRILSLYTTVDLSNNKFEGHIPSVLGDLVSLRVLNLSHNGLQGDIPPSIGNLSLVETLDLKYNQLSGEIPKQLASLTYLAFLNLSHNHLRGCIPQGPQFHTFENNSYEGNDGLRGFPVSNGCGSSMIPDTNNTTCDPDDEIDSTFQSEFRKAILMGYASGLIIGLSIAYFMLSARNRNCLSWIVEELEHKITMRRRKKQRAHQRHHRR